MPRFATAFLAFFLLQFSAFGQVLDALPAAHSGYSIRLLKAGWNTPSPAYPVVAGSSYVPQLVNGPALRVRRSSDDALQDIGFVVGGNLDQTALLNFIGGRNFLTHSEDLSNPVWSLVGLTVSSNTTAAPNGSLAADVVTETAANNEHFIDHNYSSPAASSAYTFSIYLKAVNHTNRNLILRGVFANGASSSYITFDVPGGSVVSTTGGLWTNVAITAVGSGWYLIKGTYTTPAAIPAATDLIFRLQHFETTPPANVYTGNTSISTALWGAQLQPGTVMLGYTPTASNPQLTIPSGYIHTWFDQTGNGRHITQTNQNNQPMIVDQGTVVITASGRVTVKFNGAGTYTSSSFLTNSSANLGGNSSTINMVARWNGIGGNGNEDIPFGIGTVGDVRKGRMFHRNGNMQLGWNGNSNNISGTGIIIDTTGNHHMYSAYHNGNSVTISKDGAEYTGSLAQNTLPPATGIGMGQGYNPSELGDVFTGISISEAIIFGSSLTPNERRILNCDQGAYYSQTASLPGVSFYITGTVNSAGCKMSTEQVVWNPATLSNAAISANNLTKINTSAWDGGAASFNTVSNNGYLQFRAADTNTSRLIGLSNTFGGLAVANVQYGIWLQPNATIGVYESGTLLGTFGGYNINDIFRIAVEANTVKYYRNGVLFYSSLTAPVLPLLAHATLYDLGAQVNDVVVANLNNGTFTATAVNAGTGLTYQWKVNGVNTGTNSAVYTNSSLLNGDVVTCTLSLIDCPAGTIQSNPITISAIQPNPSLTFYIKGDVNSAGCKMARENVVWKFTTLNDFDRIQRTGNSITKIAGSGWDAGAASYHTVAAGGYAEFTIPQANRDLAAGLSSSYTGPSYSNIQYCIHLSSAGSIQIYESGTSMGVFGTYLAGDVFRIASETGGIRYYKNNILIYASSTPPALPLLFHAAISDYPASINNVTISNLSAGSFTAVAQNTNFTPSYTWKVNGVTVQTGASSTYSNPAIATGAVVTCELVYGGCLTGFTASNSIQIQNTSPNPGIAFWIEGVASASGCKIAGENVVWRYTSLENSERIQATGNSLTKLTPAGWNAAAMSYNTVSDYGYLEFIASETNTNRVAGLSASYTGNAISNAQHAFYLLNNATFEVYESGIPRGNFGTYAVNDTFRVAVENNIVRYYRNGNLVYTGLPAASLPMQVFAALNETGATITDAKVYNYNNGTFLAHPVNAGATFNYQWKVNGVNVGTNSASYTNPALNSNDIVTCVLSLTGCLNNSYTSNPAKIFQPALSPSTAFYIQVTPNDAGCILAGEEVVWKYTTSDNYDRIQTSGNNLLKVLLSGWNAGAISHNQVVNNSYLEFVASETNKSRIAGLSAGYTGFTTADVQFGVYLQNNGTFAIYETGVSRGTFGTYAVSDTFRVSVESGVVKYYKNGIMFYTSLVVPVLPLYASAVLNETGASVTDAVIYKTTTGIFTSVPVNAGTAPTVAWTLNGAATGITTSSYTNASLVPGNTVGCNMTPGFCATGAVPSNNIRIRLYEPNRSLSFYIEGVVNNSGCSRAGEEVVWKFTSFSDEAKLIKNNNNLTKQLTNGWDQGAASFNTVYNNGYLEFVAQETNKSRAIGLSNSYAGPGYTVIQHSFMLQSTGIVSIYESGALRGSYGAYVTGDQFRIAVENGIVKYYRNGTLLYTSTVVPSFPLFAHASLNETGATATQVKIYNYNAGSFKARAREAGLFMNYTWKVNGVTVATGPSNSYTNNNLNIGDQITCTLNLAGCLTGNNYNSNTIDIILAPQLDLDFFIQGNVVQTGCANALEQVKWKLSDLSPSVTAPTYNSLIKNVSNGTWTGGAGSWNTVSDNGYFEFKAVETNKLRAVGLSTNDMNASLNSIQYAFYLQNDGNFRIYESGADRGLFGAYAPNTVFTIAVEAGTVRYYKSGALVYVSGVAPILPLVVDVSINEVGGTVADAFVSNRNAGSFTANLVNAGTYVWKVNGVTVQSGSSNSYTNTALNNNDVITCSLTSNITGCIPQTITSNYITYVYSRPPAAEFYIRTNPVTGNCFRGREQVQWRKNDLSTQFIAVNGFNDLIKMQGHGVWNCGAASWNTVANNGYFEFTATENNKTRAAGLSTVNTDATLASIQYCFYLLSNGTYSVYELGVNRGSFGAYTPGSVFRIAVENNIVKYYRNGNLVYISQVAPVLPLLADVSMYDTQSTITDPVVSNYHAGSFTAVSVNAGPSPSYQWKLNGTTVQTGVSATYTNTTLIPGDVINCVMTSSNTGCSPFPFYSDSVVIESTTPAGFDFAISGNAATSSCARITEPVKWKLADMSRDIIAVSQNSLLRVQGTGWNGGAASWNKVYEGGYFEFTATETNKPRVAGLSNTSINDDFVTIQYGIYLRSNGTYEIRQSGAAIALSPNVYATGDIFRVSVESNTVRYFRNGTLVYVSLITPVMPLIVDVSTYETGATITNAVVNNLSSGSFTAYSLNAGLNPTYNWKVNGVTLQSGTSATYTNLGLVTGDQVSCEIVSALSGCSSSPALSNIITNQVTGASGTDFYITATATPASCAVAREQVKWKKSDLSDNVTAVGVNSLIKNYDNLLWNGGAASWNKVSNNGFFEFTATETNRTRVAGLSTTNLNADMASIRYGVMLESTASFKIYETGIYRNVTGAYSAGDVFRIAVESNIVKYYQNGNLVYTSLLGPTLPLLVDVSIFETGGTITNATITNFHTGVFTAGVINGGTAPNYKWLVNGLQVQNGPSATYTNTTLAQNDVVTCELTPDLAGCNNLSPIASNSIVHTAIPPAQSDFYIKGNAVTSSCTMLEEEVKWRRSDLVNVQAAVNDLTKFQSDGIWDGGAASWNTVGLNGFFQFTTAENSLAKAAGLSPTNINSSNTSISYAFHLLATGEMRIMESGTDRGISMSYAAGDKFRMSVENVAGVNRVRYYKNNILVYTSTLTASVLPMLADVSIYNTGGTINDGLVSNPNNGSFIAGSVNAGTPVYNWKVNGISVQNGPLATYSNGSLSHNDVITCEMTPGLTGCNTVNVVSNITTFKGTVVQISSPASVCSPGTIDLTDPAITAGTSPDLVLTYWTNAAATIALTTPTQVSTGTYYIKGTRQGTCTDVKPVSVTVNPSPTASVTSPSGNNQLTCTTGQITLNASASHPFIWDNGTANAVRNVNAAGTYTVTATSANGCSTTTTFTVFQNSTPPVPFINGNTSPICQGATVTLTSLPSIYNNAIRFDGVAQTAELGSWFNYQTFTIEMWVKPGATQSPDATIIDNNFETGGRSWTCKQNGSTANQYQFTCFNTLGTSATATFNLTAAVWQHLTLVKTLTSLDVYINGALAVSTPWNLGIINYDGSEFLRLAAWGGQNRYWNGWMDEVRIFNKDISAARIAADMNVYFPANTTNLVAQFKMDEPDNSVSIANATGYVTSSAPVLGNPNFLPSGIPITSTFTHSWTPGGSTSASVTFTPTGPVVYQVTSTGPNGCSVTDTADITVSLSGLATITATTPGCENTTPGTITLSASGAVAPYTFFYTINGVPSSAVTAAGNSSVTVNHPATAAGTYVYSLQNLTYSNASFCLQAQSGSDSVIVYPEPLITGTIPGSTCGPGTVNLSATTTGTNIQWYATSTGGAALGTTGTFTTPVISATTTFYAQAVSAQGCSSSVRTPVIASVDIPGQWLGYTIDWDTPSNWSCNILPTSTTDVTIPTIPIGGNFPVVNSTGISVCRDLTIQAGASVTVNALRSLGIYGNVSNNGSPVWGPGELKFSGSTMQLLNATASQQAGRIWMNNSTTGSALRLMTDIKVDQQVTFTDGVLDLNGRTLTLGTAISNGTFTGQSSASYINSNGGFTKVFTNTNTTYIWPVGDTTYYTPYSLQLTSGGQSGATIQVKVIPGMQPNLPASIAYLNRYWTVEPSGLNASLSFNAVYIYAGAFEIIGGGPIFPVKYSLTAPVAGWAGCPGSSATVIAGTSGSHNPGTFTLDWQGLTAFSDFTGAGNNAPLPIELLYFEAHQELQQVLVNWATATEINNDYFDVERGRDLYFFSPIGRIAGSGTTSVPRQYSFTDPHPYEGLSYYRLRQTDFDGTSTITAPVVVRFRGESNGPLVIYYDTESGTLLHEWKNDAGVAGAVMYDATGRIVFELKETRIPENWTASHRIPDLQSGIYTVRFSVNGELYIRKVFAGR